LRGREGKGMERRGKTERWKGKGGKEKVEEEIKRGK